MNNLFRTFQLGEVAEIIAGGDKPKVFSLKKKASIRVPVLANAEKNNGLLGYTDNARIFEPAVTIAARGSNVGFVAVRKEPFFPVVRLLSLIPKKEHLDVDYLYYDLKQNRKKGTGSGQPQITIPDITSKTISLPPISVQKKVAEVLSVLDKKIELNNRINAELEAMAKTLYDYWFVQFDFPDANEKPYKSSGGKMVYNPTLKREIPAGWVVKPLSKLLNCNRAKLGKKNQLKVINYLDTANLTSNRINLIQRLVVGVDSIPSRANMIVSKNDILYSTVRPNLLHYGIIKDPLENLVASTGFAVLSHKQNSYFNIFYYMHITSPQNTNKLIRISDSSKSSYPSISPDDILSLTISLPSNADLINKFCMLVNPIFEKVSENQKEIKELEKLRDWLLPMLMNGQVTVEDMS